MNQPGQPPAPGGGGQDEMMLDYLMTMGELAPQDQDIMRKRQMAQQLRSTPTPEGRSAGRVYTAANPMEHIASAMGQGLGAYRMGQAEQQQGALNTARADAMKALRQRQMPGAGQPQQLGGPGMDLEQLGGPGMDLPPL